MTDMEMIAPLLLLATPPFAVLMAMFGFVSLTDRRLKDIDDRQVAIAKRRKAL